MAGKRPNSGYALAAISVLLVSAAQLALKLAVSRLPAVAELTDPAVWHALDLGALLWLFFGLFCYAASMVVWIPVLARLPLSAAYPLLSLSYVIVYLVATRFGIWGEIASDRRSLGLFFIILGVFLVSRPEPQRLS